MAERLTIQTTPSVQVPLPEQKKSAQEETPQATPLVEFHDVMLFMFNFWDIAYHRKIKANPQLNTFLPFRIWRFVSIACSLYSIPWKSTTKAEKIVLMNPVIYLASMISPEINAIRQAALTCGVARRSLPKLVQSVKEVTKRPFAAIGSTLLHALNLITPGYFTYHAYQAIPSSSWEERPDPSKPSCSGTSASEFAEMEPFTRFTSPKLNPTCPTDAANALGVQVDPTCEAAAARAENMCGTAKKPDMESEMENNPVCQSVFKKVGTACETTCKTIKKTWHQLSLKIHPDKHKDNPKTTPATQTLNGCKDTLNARYQCRA